MKTFEFDLITQVRKRIHVSGPPDRESACDMLRSAINGGMNPNIFAKRGDDGHAMETIIGIAEIVDPLP